MHCEQRRPLCKKDPRPSLTWGRMTSRGSNERDLDRMRSLRGATRLHGEGAAFALAGNVTVERADDGKLRCTCATWDDAVVMLKGEALRGEALSRQARDHGRACRRRQAPLHVRDLG
jgi:hypothetical protein